MTNNRVMSSVWIWCLGILLTIGGALWWSAWTRSARHLKTAQMWVAQGDTQRALRHYQWSARAYAPGSHAGARALEQMWNLARRAEETQPELALEAYDLMRGAIWSTRWLSTPYHAWSSRVDERIIALRHVPFTPERFAATISADPRPSIFQSAMLFICILGVIISMTWLVRVGITPDLQFTAQAIRPAWALSVMMTGILISLAI